MLRTFLIKRFVRWLICGNWNPIPPYGKRRSFGWKGRLVFRIERLLARMHIIIDPVQEYDMGVEYRGADGKLKSKL